MLFSAAMAAGDDVTVISRGEGYLIGCWRNLYVIDFRVTPTIEAIDKSVAGKRTVLERHPQGVVVLNFLAQGPMPPSEVRAHAAKAQTKDIAGVLGHATVIDATGFAASAMRSILTGLFLVERHPFPRKVFSASQDAVSWLSQQSSATADWAPGALRAANELRRR